VVGTLVVKGDVLHDSASVTVESQPGFTDGINPLSQHCGFFYPQFNFGQVWNNARQYSTAWCRFR
jgi:hypothetical protein